MRLSKLKFYFLIATVFTLITTQIVFSQTKPLTLIDVFNLLQSKKVGETINQKNRFTLDRVKRRGVDFELTPQIESSIKQLKANANLIEAIRFYNVNQSNNQWYWKKQYIKSRENRVGKIGKEVSNVSAAFVSAESVLKQRNHLKSMLENNYEPPMDYVDLAQKVLDGNLVMLTWATKNYVLDSGGIVDSKEFMKFSFENSNQFSFIDADSRNYKILLQIANKISPIKLNLKIPEHRKILKRNLLKTLHPQAKLILEKLATDYQRKFNRPLRITSTTRSFEYQIKLNKINANSFKVRGKDSFPPHTSGNAFDIPFTFMNASEQQFILNILTELKNSGKAFPTFENDESRIAHVYVPTNDTSIRSGRGSGQGSNISSGSGRGSGVGSGSGSGTGKRIVSGNYVNIDKINPTTITPLKILSKPNPGYTKTAKDNNVQGAVWLRVSFLSSGKIGNVRPIKGLPFGLTEKAIEAARKIKFTPAIRNGTPYSVTKRLVYNFVLN